MATVRRRSDFLLSEVNGNVLIAGDHDALVGRDILRQLHGVTVLGRGKSSGESRVIGIRAVGRLHRRDRRSGLRRAADRALAIFAVMVMRFGRKRAVVGIALTGVGAVAVIGVNIAVAMTAAGGTAGAGSGLGDDVGLVVGDGLTVDGQAGRAVRDHDFGALGRAGDFDVLGDDEHDALAVSLDGRARLVSIGVDGAGQGW